MCGTFPADSCVATPKPHVTCSALTSARANPQSTGQAGLSLINKSKANVKVVSGK